MLELQNLRLSLDAGLPQGGRITCPCSEEAGYAGGIGFRMRKA